MEVVMNIRDFTPGTRRRQAPALDGATAWLNSDPLTPADVQGHVVAYDFWTYTCVNWLRTLPYIRAWADRYREAGLIVVGIHTPEFVFEHELANVQEAVRVDRIDYPVAVDNDYAVWRAFDNHYWPALYLADANGVIRHKQFGEGSYEQAEENIRVLLEESGARDLPRDAVNVVPEGVEVAADWDHLGSPETYLGIVRGERFVPARDEDPGASRAYVVPHALRLNEWGLAGDWTIRQDAAFLDEGAGTIAYRFRARDVNLVMGSTRGETPFRVLIDGEPPGSSSGADCDDRGGGVVTGLRLYQLIRQHHRIGEHTFEITFGSPGIGAYVFTFG
jgi:thiol-disulfide isomerase/thioredoxin